MARKPKKEDSTMVDENEAQEGEEEEFSTFENDDETIDMGGVDEASFEAIPKGKYEAVVNSVEYGLSENSGKPMWTWEFELTDGEYVGRKFYFYTSFSAKALPLSKANIAAIDPELAASAFNPRVVAEEGRLIGKPAILEVAIQKRGEYKGRNRIARIHPAVSTNQFLDA